MDGHPIDLVVARFDEDAAWLLEVVANAPGPVRVFVYDKGTTDLGEPLTSALRRHPGVSCVAVTRLPNVGRESHTYLEHVIRMRKTRMMKTRDVGEADGVTVFMQGRMDDHVPDRFDGIAAFVASMVEEAWTGAAGESANHACHTQHGAFNAVPGLRVSMFPGVGDSGRDLAGWFSVVFPACAWPSGGPSWWQHGVFAIRTCRMMSEARSDAYYRTLRAQVDWHVNPEAGHFFERCWRHVFPRS